MQWLHRNLDFSARCAVMGVINCTPDSFFPSSRMTTLEAALETALDMIRAGVDIIDIGGESSRPGALPVSIYEERARIIPLILGIRKHSDILISVDTYKTEVAAVALDAGADIINDIFALRNNPALAKLIAERGVPVILMHMHGEPATMQKQPGYSNIIEDVCSELEQSIRQARQWGIKQELIIIDPGIGFGKSPDDNLKIIKHLNAFKRWQFPVLIGVSRKSFLGKILDKEPEERLTGTITANTIAILNGADIIRVHDYKEAIDMVKVIAAITKGSV